MNKYEKALNQMCRCCKTAPSNCNKAKCNRYNAIKELIEVFKTLNDKVYIAPTWLTLDDHGEGVPLTQQEYDVLSEALGQY